MRKLKNLIERIFTKKNIKVFLLVFVVVWFFLWKTFAQSTVETLTPVEKISHYIHILTGILSRGWVVLATLAWKFMTNEFVYGSFLHLDKALWNLWNIMKNFANFALWFILLFSIVKNLFSSFKKDANPINDSIKIVWKVLIAGVLVQISRFLLWALLDVTTVATAAVGSLPSQFMSSDTDFQNDMRQLLAKPHTKLVVNFDDENMVDKLYVQTWVANTEEEIQQLVDTIMPGSDSVVWPFIFIWSSVFNLFDLSDTSQNESDTDDIWDLFLQLGINGFVLFSFSIMLALIFIFNLFRVITLWIVIPLLPIMIVLSVLSGWKNSKLKWFFWDIMDFSKIIKLVIKPVYMTLVLWVILIVMVLIRTLVNAQNGSIDMQSQNNMTIESKKEWSWYESSLDIWNVAQISMSMKNSIVDLFVYILWIALMIMLMKSCVSWDITWIKFIDDKMNNLSKMIWWEKWKFWWILWNMWVIPTWYTDKNGNPVKLWIWNTVDYLKNNNVLYNKMSYVLWIDVGEQDNALRSALWIKNSSSFAVLNAARYVNNKKLWLEKAVEIWQSKNLTLSQMMWNTDFWNALDYYDEKNKHKPENKIKRSDVEAQWNSTTGWWSSGTAGQWSQWGGTEGWE